MPIYNLVLIICWFAFLLYWLISSFNIKKNSRGGGQGWIVRGVLILAIIVIFRTQINNAVSTFHIVSSTNAALGIIGDALCIVGVGIAIWARKNLGVNWGMPRTIKYKPDLVTSGPYKYVRHPIYTGVLLAILGSVFVSGIAWLLIFFVATVYFIYSGKREEQDMQKEFGDKYKKYMKNTKFIIPLIF
ncbi:MAG TPA: isoprenylcysteine carboxylmethyltransferase family protein [Patescibacteria group bacterium]|nr:isoprenylcysteine carboxylmethyltransferase family protein [Patescibacteria group bacterium]